MKTFLFAITCTFWLFLGSHQAVAQPGCRYSYPISLDCPNVSGDTVVLGRVVQLIDIDRETGEQTETKDLGGFPQGKIVITVEDVLKGSADAVIELMVDGTCYGPMQEGRRHIFNLTKTSNGYSNPKWSNSLDYLKPNERDEFLNAHRVLIRGDRLRTLFGTVRVKDGRDPVVGVTIVAEKDGVKFEAVTDATGRYEFSELPEGEYEVRPLLEPALRPAENREIPHAKPGDTARISRDTPCGFRLDFIASHNGVISGRIENHEGKPFDVSAATLWRFREDDGSKYPYRKGVKRSEPGAFSFVNLPPGRYLIEVMTAGTNLQWLTFYYPGVVYETDAKMIDLPAGQEVSGLVFRLPPH